MKGNQGPNYKQLLSRNFNLSAQDYESCAVLQRTVAEQLADRLALMNVKPRVALDLGSGTGFGARLLENRYKRCAILQTDLALNMLKTARQTSPRFFSPQRFLCADAENLPLRGKYFDLVFSSLMLQWCGNPESAFREVWRVMKPSSLFLFATLGPDTLKELRDCWNAVDTLSHVNEFADMHEVGDLLVLCGFEAPVLEMEYFTLNYADVFSLMRDLKRLGAVNINMGRRLSLTGKGRMRQLVQEYERWRNAGRLPATYEVIFGHAWKPAEGKGHDLVNKPPFPVPVRAIHN